MGKFVRQSVYGWQQFRNDIKKKSNMFEGKEFVGWDLPMHEQMRLYRIQEARIVETANYANFSDSNPTSPSAGGGKSLFKISKKNVFHQAQFRFTNNGSVTGSGAAINNSSSIGRNFIDLYTPRQGQSTNGTGGGNDGYQVRVSFETSSLDNTEIAPIGQAQFRLTQSVNMDLQATTTASILTSLRDTINNEYFMNTAGTTTTAFRSRTYFSASTALHAANGTILTISAKLEGTVRRPWTTNLAVGTGSVTTIVTGEDVLCGADKTRWSNQDLGPADFPTLRRLEGRNN